MDHPMLDVLRLRDNYLYEASISINRVTVDSLYLGSLGPDLR